MTFNLEIYEIIVALNWEIYEIIVTLNLEIYEIIVAGAYSDQSVVYGSLVPNFYHGPVI